MQRWKRTILELAQTSARLEHERVVRARAGSRASEGDAHDLRANPGDQERLGQVEADVRDGRPAGNTTEAVDCQRAERERNLIDGGCGADQLVPASSALNGWLPHPARDPLVEHRRGRGPCDGEDADREGQHRRVLAIVGMLQ